MSYQTGFTQEKKTHRCRSSVPKRKQTSSYQ